MFCKFTLNDNVWYAVRLYTKHLLLCISAILFCFVLLRWLLLQIDLLQKMPICLPWPMYKKTSCNISTKHTLIYGLNRIAMHSPIHLSYLSIVPTEADSNEDWIHIHSVISLHYHNNATSNSIDPSYKHASIIHSYTWLCNSCSPIAWSLELGSSNTSRFQWICNIPPVFISFPSKNYLEYSLHKVYWISHISCGNDLAHLHIIINTIINL